MSLVQFIIRSTAYFKFRFGDLDPLCAVDIQDVLNDEYVALILGVIEQESATESPTRAHSLSPISNLALEQKRGCWRISSGRRKVDTVYV